MPTTCESRRSVFRRVAQKSHVEWPVYDSTPLYDRSSLTGLESDFRTVSEAWFDQDTHTSAELFVCTVPLAYFRFDPHNRYANSTRYEMATLFRLFVLKTPHRSAGPAVMAFAESASPAISAACSSPFRRHR